MRRARLQLSRAKGREARECRRNQNLRFAARKEAAWVLSFPQGLTCVRENRAAPEGLGIFSHCTQHSAFGYVLGYDMSRLRRLIFAGHTPPAKMKPSSHADTKARSE